MLVFDVLSEGVGSGLDGFIGLGSKIGEVAWLNDVVAAVVTVVAATVVGVIVKDGESAIGVGVGVEEGLGRDAAASVDSEEMCSIFGVGDRER